MISIVHQGNQRYNIFRAGQDIGCIRVSTNLYHNQNRYLDLGLTQFDPAIAEELFSLLRKELDSPLQVMCCSRKNHHDFLNAGGFERRRRCFELEVSPADLIAPLHASTKLHTAVKGLPMYTSCCELLYDYYRKTHESVSPLTVPQEGFCADLPETVLCHTTDGKPIHCAFIEPGKSECEIAYVASTDLSSFCGFAQTLVHALFQKYATLTAECDDNDPAATILKSMFRTSSDDSYDTYILE